MKIARLDQRTSRLLTAEVPQISVEVVRWDAKLQ